MAPSESRSPVVCTRSRTDPGFPGTGGADGESEPARRELSGWRGDQGHPAIRVQDRFQNTPGGGSVSAFTTKRGPMPDPTAIPDGRDLIRTMGWTPLPYSCAGVVRKTAVSGRNTVWSWLILIPWASDSKPWVDGTEVVPASTKTEDQEREQILAKMRTLLDERYGETVASRAVDDLIQSILEEE